MNIGKRYRTSGTVKYYIFVNEKNVIYENNSNNKRTLLSKIAIECIRHVEKITESYIWHCEKFNLRACDKDEEIEYGGCICGSVNFQGNMNDEWFVVYILYQLSIWDEYEFFIKIIDDDGQFLLAEVADVLPVWAQPDTCENRLILYDGCFRLVPIDVISGNPSFQNVLLKLNNLILDSMDDNSRKIDDIIKKNRINNMPNILKALKHKALCYVPSKVGLFLEKHKEMIPFIIDAYYYRNEEDVEMCKNSSLFFTDLAHRHNCQFEDHLKQQSQGCVQPLCPIVIEMTRLRYAQIIDDSLIKPKCLIKSIDCTTYYSNEKNSKRRVSLGMKLTCGLEIMTRSFGIGDWDYRFYQFIQSLDRKMYFKNTLIGSKEYNLRLMSAKNFFEKQEGNRNYNNHKNKFEIVDENKFQKNPFSKHIYNFLIGVKNDSNGINNNIKEELLERGRALSKEEFKRLESEEDEDSWLKIDHDTFMEHLSEKFSMKIPTSKNKPLNMNQNLSKLNNLTATLEDFLNNESSYEGVENDSGVNLNADTFVSVLKNFNSGDTISNTNNKNNHESTEKDEELNINLAMQMMDDELSSTTAAETFDRIKNSNIEKDDKDDKNDKHFEENKYKLDPLNLDYNLVTNLLQALEVENNELQDGVGPVSVLLNNLEETSDLGSWLPTG